MTPADGPAVAALSALGRPTAGGPIRLYTVLSPEAAPLLLNEQTGAVVAEAPGVEGVVGMGWMTTGECWFEGELRRYAYLFNQVVHPGFRRRGIGKQTTVWRMALARERWGDDVLFFARIRPSNTASLSGARWWTRQRVEGRVVSLAAGLRRKPPSPAPGIEVRPAAPNELQAFVEGANECYRGVNFYPPLDVAALQARLRRSAFGRRLNECLVAVGRGGRLLAGLVLTENGEMGPVQVQYAHPLIRAASVGLRIAPPDDVVRPIRAGDFWFAPGQAGAAAHLWESARWLWRERGTLLTIALDPQSAAVPIVRPRWLARTAPYVLVLAGPVPMREDAPVYVQHT